MKMLLVIMMIRLVFALIDNTKRKKKDEACNEAGNANVQHPAATLLR